MKKILSLVLALATIAASCMIFTACNNAGEGEKLGLSKEAVLPAPELVKDFETADDFKIGIICLHDENSTYDKNFISAVNDVKTVLGLRDDQVLLKTGIDESDACYNTAVELVESGCQLIFADSFGHEPFIIQAAKDYPDVQFCHATGTNARNAGLSNFHDAFASIYEGRYCAGIAAGMKLNEMIADGKIKAEEAVIGYVGAFTYAEIISGMTSFYLGARSVCESATMKVRYTGSWYDQALEQEAATALINEDKCVLISQHADSLGAPTACELAGVPNVSYNGSTYEAGENTFIISSAINWRPYFLEIIKCVSTGKAIESDYVGTIANGSIILSGINQDVMAKDTVDKINEAIDGFKAGTLHVFDTSKFTVDGKNLSEYLVDLDGDGTGETNVIHDGYFDESGAGFRSAPYFDIIIDGVTNLNTSF